MTRDDVEILGKETLFQGWFRLERLRVRHKLFQGGLSVPFTRELLIRHGATGVVPYDPVTDRVCIIEQFRAGVYAGGAEPWSLEIIAGVIGEGESPEDVARREAVEEAGLTVKRIKPMLQGFTMPGASNEKFHFFCGEVDLTDATSRIFGLEHEQENIRTHIVSRAEAIAWCDAGRFNNIPAIVAMHWLARFGEALQKEWLL